MIFKIDLQQLAPTTLRYQIQKQDLTYVLASDIESLTLSVFETETETQTTPDGGIALDLDTSTFAEMQSWDVDDVGFNISVFVDGSYFPNANKTYRIQVIVVQGDGSTYPLKYVEGFTEKTYA